jgi:hypothetical protein
MGFRQYRILTSKSFIVAWELTYLISASILRIVKDTIYFIA